MRRSGVSNVSPLCVFKFLTGMMGRRKKMGCVKLFSPVKEEEGDGREGGEEDEKGEEDGVCLTSL